MNDAQQMTIGDLRANAALAPTERESEAWELAANEIERLRAENAALKAQLGPALVAHGSGFETSVHLLGALCSRCQPQIEITDSMVERAMDAFCGVDRGKGVDHWYCDPDERPSMRAALEAVLGGNEK